MSGEWKPGDVAIVADDQGRTGRGICNVKGGWDFTPDGADMSCYSMAHEIVSARPLAVIDLDDDEQMERLADAWDEAGPRGALTDRLRAALRAFANPTPRIEEPQGLGAVVEDAEGQKWIRWEIVDRHTKPWAVPGSVKPNRAFAQIDAVRVLAEGVAE